MDEGSFLVKEVDKRRREVACAVGNGTGEVEGKVREVVGDHSKKFVLCDGGAPGQNNLFDLALFREIPGGGWVWGPYPTAAIRINKTFPILEVKGNGIDGDWGNTSIGDLICLSIVQEEVILLIDSNGQS